LSPKHIATHTAHVRVGVTKRRNGPGAYPNIHPAQVEQGGQTQGKTPHIVTAENAGSHSKVLRPSPTGIPNNTGSFQGASGAQFIGSERQDHPPNPQENHLINASIPPTISSTVAFIVSRDQRKSSLSLKYGLQSSSSGIPSQSVSCNNFAISS